MFWRAFLGSKARPALVEGCKASHDLQMINLVGESEGFTQSDTFPSFLTLLSSEMSWQS
jgi:hypothetical protein